MFDANYFRSLIARDAAATGGSPVVELQLHSGFVHRVRGVLEVGDGCVTLATYQLRGDLSHERPRFGDAETTLDLLRVVVAYESIAAVVIDPAPAQPRARPGFSNE